MEDLFELLIVIAIGALGIISKSNKNKKKKAADKPAKAVEPIPEPAQPITAARKDVNRRSIEAAVAAFTDLLESEAELPNPDKPAPKTVREPTAIETELKQTAPLKAKRKKKNPASGESPVDAHGCIGGSMPAHSAEGESLAEHAQHELERRQHLQQNAPVIAVESLRRPSQQELRRAIVMSEVLDKPVSLKGRRL